MIKIIAIFAAVALGFSAGHDFAKMQESYLESEQALLDAEMAGMERMEEAMRHMCFEKGEVK